MGIEVAGQPWKEFLAERPIAVIATVSPNGMPHAVPVEVVVHGGRLYVWCHATSRKARNAAREGRAALMAYKGHHGVLTRGPVRVVAEGDPRYTEISQAFLDKYEREETYGNDTLIEITPERVTAF